MNGEAKRAVAPHFLTNRTRIRHAKAGKMETMATGMINREYESQAGRCPYRINE
jgi:hypothetical protein